MKMKGFKKFFVSIGLSAVLTLGCASTAFASTGELQPVESAIEQSTENAEVPQLENGEADAAGSYLTSSSGIAQISATTTSISIQWNSVYGASKYRVYISTFGGSSYKLLGDVSSTNAKINKLSASAAYTVRVYAMNFAGSAISYRTVDCTTLYKKPKVDRTSETSSGYTFYMKTVDPTNSITGYKVIYESSKTHKKTTKYFNSRYSFTLPLAKNSFYRVKIYPYVTFNGTRCVSNSPTTKYVSRGVVLSKGGNTNTTMTVKWSKVYGANNYSVYIKYPGKSSYTKVRTTTSTSFTLTGMRRYSSYGIKVIANKKIDGQTWTSAQHTYSMGLY